MSVAAVQIPDVIQRMLSWIDDRHGSRFVAVTGMHGIVEARKDPEFRAVLNDADLVVPDGMPLVWIGRSNGHRLARRVYGPELLETFCRETGPAYRHFFFGGAPGVPDRLAALLHERHGITVAGVLSPPFRPPTPEEEDGIVAAIADARPDVLWVGLSTPKQERWMREHVSALDVPVLVGVGAAFDFLTGTKRMAPAWMQERGLEWLFRLATEPRRLWHRYLVGGSQFVYWLALERARGRRAAGHGRRGGTSR